MKVAGYNVPQNGSWGPYQQKIWDKLNTREKEYKPTIWGLLQKGYDTIIGNTTYQAVQPTITATSGDPDRSKKLKHSVMPIIGIQFMELLEDGKLL